MFGGLDGRLLAACHRGDTSAARAALAAGADVEACDESAYTLFGALWHCWTPLLWASCNGHAAVVDLLLEAGAEPEARSGDGTTPLKAASAKGRVDVVRILLSRGCRVDVVRSAACVSSESCQELNTSAAARRLRSNTASLRRMVRPCTGCCVVAGRMR